MASLESRLFYSLLKVINKKKFLQLQFTFGKFDFNTSRKPPPETNRSCTITQRQIKGRDVYTLTPKSTTSGKHILYLHGGAYVQNFVKQHWKFLAILVQRTHCTVTAPDYPLAPVHTFKDAFDMVTPLYREIIDLAGPPNMILMGDSAGGGFALALAQKMLMEKTAQPAKIILLSPWLDITLKNPEIRKVDKLDPFLGIPGLLKAGAAYAGNTDPDNFMLSPVNGPLQNLGHISLFIGSRDILVADARKLDRLAQEAGIKINYREYPDMVHVWMLLNFPESMEAKKEIVALIME